MTKLIYKTLLHNSREGRMINVCQRGKKTFKITAQKKEYVEVTGGVVQNCEKLVLSHATAHFVQFPCCYFTFYNKQKLDRCYIFFIKIYYHTQFQ
jgi:hypothetical protein